MKKFKKKLRLGIVIPAVVVVGLIVVAILLVSGGVGTDDQSASAPKPVLTPGDLKSGKFKGKKIKPPPRRKSPGVVNESRREGRLVLAQARGTLVRPGRVRLRVSAAPKQSVVVDWQLGCYKNRRAKIGRGRYKTRTPNTRQIPISLQGAESCIATATAGLTKVDGRGRVKVAVIAG